MTLTITHTDPSIKFGFVGTTKENISLVDVAFEGWTDIDSVPTHVYQEIINYCTYKISKEENASEK